MTLRINLVITRKKLLTARGRLPRVTTRMQVLEGARYIQRYLTIGYAERRNILGHFLLLGNIYLLVSILLTTESGLLRRAIQVSLARGAVDRLEVCQVLRAGSLRWRRELSIQLDVGAAWTRGLVHVSELETGRAIGIAQMLK